MTVERQRELEANRRKEARESEEAYQEKML
jgi:hypothetical protein